MLKFILEVNNEHNEQKYKKLILVLIAILVILSPFAIYKIYMINKLNKLEQEEVLVRLKFDGVEFSDRTYSGKDITITESGNIYKTYYKNERVGKKEKVFLLKYNRKLLKYSKLTDQEREELYLEFSEYTRDVESYVEEAVEKGHLIVRSPDFCDIYVKDVGSTYCGQKEKINEILSKYNQNYYCLK